MFKKPGGGIAGLVHWERFARDRRANTQSSGSAANRRWLTAQDP
jgi:hypothetical protein